VHLLPKSRTLCQPAGQALDAARVDPPSEMLNPRPPAWHANR